MEGISQQDLELYGLMQSMGDSRVRERFEQMRSRGQLSQTSPGARLVAESSSSVIEAVQAYMGKQKRQEGRQQRIRDCVSFVGVERCVLIGMRCVVDNLSSTPSDDGFKRRTTGTLQNKIGTAIQREADFKHLEKVNPDYYNYLCRRSHKMGGRDLQNVKLRLQETVEEKDAGWDNQDKMLVGGFVLDFITRFSGLFTVTREKRRDGWGKDKFYGLVNFKDEVTDWLTDGINFLATTSPANLPITTPPYDWGPNQIGGYPGRDTAPIDMMTTKRKSQYSHFLRSDCPDVYEALNTIQRVPWRINKATFQVFELALRQGWDDAGFCGREPVKPTRPEHEFVQGCPVWKAYTRKRREWKVLDERYRFDSLAASRTQTIGEVYSAFDRFYYPHQIDYRGRCYPIGCPISYQGPDWQRGLVEFADGKPLGDGLDWFLIHGANCWGEDKVGFQERMDWVEENEDRILHYAEDPVAYRGWTEADKPFQFLAWCFEYTEMMLEEDPRAYVSHLPIAMDGSNNGLQIYSLMMRDPVGCEATNCLPVSEPQDAYQRVADKLTERLKGIRENDQDPVLRRRAARVLDFLKMNGMDGFPRKAVKRPVMTLPYGATVYASQRYLVEWYHDFVRGRNLPPELVPFPERDVYATWNWVGRLVWDIIGEVVVKAREAMDWIREAADVMSQNGLQFEWTTPLGMSCTQRYSKGYAKRVKLRTAAQAWVRVFHATEEVNASKAANGSCPNFIHSYDAAAMMRTVCRASAQGVTHYQMIHDSFATHAADTPVLAQVLRESYVEILSGNPLMSLRESLQSSLPEGVTVPHPPQQGNVNLRDLLHANYFFA